MSSAHDGVGGFDIDHHGRAGGVGLGQQQTHRERGAHHGGKHAQHDLPAGAQDEEELLKAHGSVPFGQNRLSRT